jgi:hypothetical protein
MLQKKVIEEVEEMITKLTQSCAEVGAWRPTEGAGW